MMKLFSLKEQQQNRAATGQGAGDKGQTAAHLRLQKDMADLSLPAQCKVELDEADPLNFRLFVSPDEGFYLGGRFHFSFAVPRAYPHEPPKVKCLTKVYHPNIDLDGNVCLNILREEWKPILTITGVIFGLLFLFVEPNPEDPLNKDAAHTLTHNKRAFEQNVHKSPAQTNLSPSAHSSSSSVPMFSKPDSYFHSTHLVEMRPRPCKEVASEYARFLRESDRASRMSRLAELLSNLSEFRIHTGNINQWAALKQKRFENSSEELTECLKMQLESWVPSEAQLKESEEGSVTLCENRECGPCTLTDIGERDNLAVTLKIFLSGVCPVQARRCLDSVLQELQTGRVEKLIVALSLEAEGSSEAEEAVAWVESFWPLWESLCGLVAEGKVRELGVADLELDFLSALVNKADRLGALRPAIDHYNLQSCCSVPDELQAYAKEKGIKLLTHNDPKPFCTDNRLEEICCTYLNMPVCPLPGAVKWVARYAVMIVSRSIMTAKGFVVDFGNCDKSIGRP